VENLADGAPVASAAETPHPYLASWIAPSLGRHMLAARATDSLGRTITSPSAGITVLPAAPAVIIAPGSTWKYFDTGMDLGTAWRGPGFDPSAWPEGPARLGFGNDGEVTTVASNRQWTTYFRREFYIPDPTLLLSLAGRLSRDDAAVIYLNGAEIWRDTNMPSGVITNQTPARRALGGTSETGWLTLELQGSPLNLLAPGWNLLAAEVHQSSLSSSDLGFDLELMGTQLVVQPPTLGMAPSAQWLAWPAAAGTFSVHWTTNVGPGAIWLPLSNAPVFSNDAWLVPLSIPTNSRRFYRLQAP